MSFKAIRLTSMLVLLVVVLGTLYSPRLFGFDDTVVLLVPVEFVLGICALSVLMTLLPRRCQQPVAGALPTSGAMARRMDGPLTALGMMKARSVASDLAALRSGTTLYARGIRVDGPPAMVSLLISAPDGQPVRLDHQRVLGKQVEQLPGPYTVSEPLAMDPVFSARRGKMTESVEISGSGEHGMVVQLRPLDARLLRELTALQPVAR